MIQNNQTFIKYNEKALPLIEKLKTNYKFANVAQIYIRAEIMTPFGVRVTQNLESKKDSLIAIYDKYGNR